MIDAILQPYIEKLPIFSDERDIDEDFEEEIVFKEQVEIFTIRTTHLPRNAGGGK